MFADNVPQFGVKAPGLTYTERSGAYALAMRDTYMLVIETPAGLFLPGGGLEDGEMLEDALRREVREEAGLDIVNARHWVTARQHVIERGTGLAFNKVEAFYIVEVEVRELPAAGRENGHRACWKPLTDVLAGLREEAQAWAVRSFSSGLPGQ